MKKILGLAFGLLLTAFTYAQSNVTFNDATDSYDKTATTVFHFTFDDSYTQEKIEKGSQYYTDYFTVAIESDNGNFNVTVSLVQDDAMSRRVITRFLITCEVNEVDVNGAALPLDEFMGTYIMI